MFSLIVRVATEKDCEETSQWKKMGWLSSGIKKLLAGNNTVLNLRLQMAREIGDKLAWAWKRES